MEAWNWTAISTVVALALGLTSIAVGHVLPQRRERARGRRAVLEVRREYYWRKDTQRMQERLVIRNAGPHAAWNVDLGEVIGQIRDRVEPMDLAGSGINWYLPVPVLQPLQDHHLIFETSLDDPNPVEVTVRWDDGDGNHEERFALSPRYP